MESQLSVPFEGATEYSEEYKAYVFRFWYNNSKRGAMWVHKNISIRVDFRTGKELTEDAIRKWITADFKEYATSLDTEVGKSLDAAIIKERVEMLTKHAVISVEMQEMALKHLRDPDIVLDTRTAIQLLITGIKIERESRGLPLDELLRFKDQSDKELVETLRDIVTESKILDISPNDDTAYET